MPGEKEGELINLIWEGWIPDSFYIKGHIPIKEALTVLQYEDVLTKVDSFYDRTINYWITKEYELILSTGHHNYARWSTEPGPDDCPVVLRDYGTPGKGRFKVTRFDVIGKRVTKEISEPNF